jgi:hypothetical protein
MTSPFRFFKMKAFGILAVAVVLAAQVQSRPQYGSGGGGDEPECVTKCQLYRTL